MSNISKMTLLDLKDTFEKIYKILDREGESNWIRGISSICQRLNTIDEHSNLEDLYREIGVSYRNMNSGAGSFADFMVWRDDSEERVRVNKEFGLLADKAWQQLDL